MSRYASYDDYDDYTFSTFDDGSSTRTFYTQKTYPSARVERQQPIQEDGWSDSLHGVCRAACELLWWLALDGRNQQGTTSTKRSHRLRIIDSTGNESEYPNHTAPTRPVRWKNKESPMPSLQSTYSSDGSSTRSSYGSNVNWKGSKADDSSASIRRERGGASNNVGFNASESMKTTTSSSNVKDFHTIDSRVVQRRRQHKKQAQSQGDASPISEDWSPHNTYPIDQPDQIQVTNPLPLGLPPLPPPYARKDTQKGILKSSRIGQRENGSTAESQTPSGLWNHKNSTEIHDSEQQIHKAKAKREPTCGWMKDRKEQKSSATWFMNIQGEIHQNHILHRRANSLDGMIPPDVDGDNMVFRQQPHRISVQPKVPMRMAQKRQPNAGRCSSATSPHVTQHAASTGELINEAYRDEVESWEDIRMVPRRSSFFERPQAEAQRDTSLSSLESMSSASVSGTSSSEASRPTNSNSISRAASVLSAGSYSSARKTKKKWLRNRPSFENDCEFAPTSSQLKTYRSKPQTLLVKNIGPGERSYNKDRSIGSVTSMDRRIRKPRICARREKETMSVC